MQENVENESTHVATYAETIEEAHAWVCVVIRYGHHNRYIAMNEYTWRVGHNYTRLGIFNEVITVPRKRRAVVIVVVLLLYCCCCG